MQKIPSSSLGGDTNPWKDCIRKSNWYKKLCQIKIFSSVHCSKYEISRIRVSVICITFHIVDCQPCDRLAPVQVVPRLLPYGIGVNPELDKWMDDWQLWVVLYPVILKQKTPWMLVCWFSVLIFRRSFTHRVHFCQSQVNFTSFAMELEFLTCFVSCDSMSLETQWLTHRVFCLFVYFLVLGNSQYS